MINQGSMIILKIKLRFKDNLSMEKSIGHLMKTGKNFYFISIGIQEINDGIKNPKRFKIIILQLIYYAIINLILALFSVSNYFYSQLETDFLLADFKIFVIGFSLSTIWVLPKKIDMFLAERKWNLSPLKVFYYLINNIKSKHKLADLNYNRLAILSRIIIIILDYGPLIPVVILMESFVLIAILSQKFIWIFLSICLVPYLIIADVAFSSWMCINLILFSYYKMRFDQIHSSIKSIVSNGQWNVINKRRERQLINLIEEHKSVSNEIHKLNLMFHRSAGVMITFISILRTIAIYLLINSNNNIFINVMLSVGFCLIFFFGFGLSYLFSHQIKSAHQSDKLINLILCRFKMRLQFRFKVNN